MASDGGLNFEEWARALRSPFLQETLQSRLAAVAHFQDAGPAAVPFLSRMLSNENETEIGRTWAAISLEQIKPAATRELLDVAARALAASDPSIRRAVLNLLGATASPEVIPLVRRYLGDDGRDPSAWFDDDCTVSHAAEAALQRIGTPEAREIILTMRTCRSEP